MFSVQSVVKPVCGIRLDAKPRRVASPRLPLHCGYGIYNKTLLDLTPFTFIFIDLCLLISILS